jgi:F0F1-type ATP synthase assembly protein I
MTGPEVPPEPPPDSKRTSPSGMELAGLGVFLAAVVVIPLVIGLRVDAALGSSPVGLGLGLVLGILAGFAGVYVRFRRYV